MDVLNDDALGLVLERVDSHVSLIRAAAVCRRWRRAIADAAFLRRYRSRRAPSVAGDYHNGAWHPRLMGTRTYDGPAFVPSSTSMVNARHFSLDFLPNGAGYWKICDTRGSLLLMVPKSTRSDILVCEPLTQRYMMVPTPAVNASWYLESYLIDGDCDKTGGCIGMSNFRVLCMFTRDFVTRIAIFTLDSSWSEKGTDHSLIEKNFLPRFELPDFLGRAGGSRYFYAMGGMLIHLDGSTGDFTSSVLPAIEDWDQQWNRVAEGRDGKPRILTILDDTVKIFAILEGGEWGLEKSVLLSEATRGLPGFQPSFFNYEPDILTMGTGFVTFIPRFAEKPWPYCIDLETMEATLAAGDMGSLVYRSELPWPPALHACLHRSR